MARKPATPATAGPATEGIKVQCRQANGLWRGGRHWPAEETTVPLSELTPEQLEAVEAEPLLLTVRVELPAA